jgi:hypothetical protein
VAEAKRWTANGPVFITDRGTPAHVLMSIDEYRRLTNAGGSLIDALAMEGGQDIDFDPPKINFKSRLPGFGDG